jgi:hypothetical protein
MALKEVNRAKTQGKRTIVQNVPSRISTVISNPGFWRPHVAFFFGRVRLLGLANQIRGVGEGFYGEQLVRSVTRLAAGHNPDTLILDFRRVGREPG